MNVRLLAIIFLAATLRLAIADEPPAPADLVLTGGKIATVDAEFRIVTALAVRAGQIVAVGDDATIATFRGPETKTIDLAGKFVTPGLIDNHVHPDGAALHEFDHPIPPMETMADVLDYVQARAKVVPIGEWIVLRQVFITRLKEQRYPTRQELDEAAPEHPVMFATGPDAQLSSLALKESGIDRNFQHIGSGIVERDAEGEPTGLLRSCTYLAKPKTPSVKSAGEEQRLERLRELFADYNSVGLTTVADRAAGEDTVGRCKSLKDNGRLTVRVAFSMSFDGNAPLDKAKERLAEIAAHPLRRGVDPWLQVIGVKTFLDGGMLTGSAYMREPWGLSDIYLIRDPRYRGVLFIPQEQLVPLVQATVDAGLQFTAHAVGDGAVHNLLDAYEQANQRAPVRPTRPCLTHSNFMSSEAVDQMVALGVVADIQPAWLYLDAHTLHKQFGEERLAWFQPLKAILDRGGVAGGGSDHMQRIGSMRSVNPYNPFLGMWVAMTRRSKFHPEPLHMEHALSREQALRYYTCHNAFMLFMEDRVGSLEVGKRADLIILDRDLLTCPIDDVKDAVVLRTIVDGREVYTAGN